MALAYGSSARREQPPLPASPLPKAAACRQPSIHLLPQVRRPAVEFSFRQGLHLCKSYHAKAGQHAVTFATFHLTRRAGRLSSLVRVVPRKSWPARRHVRHLSPHSSRRATESSAASCLPRAKSLIMRLARRLSPLPALHAVASPPGASDSATRDTMTSLCHVGRVGSRWGGHHRVTCPSQQQQS